MGSKRILYRKVVDEEGNVLETAIWRVPVSAKAPDGVRYRLAFIPAGMREPAVLYDNHHPKGHHRHVEGVQEPYRFETVDKLVRDFKADVERVRRRR
jgi:hypothetical protein